MEMTSRIRLQILECLASLVHKVGTSLHIQGTAVVRWSDYLTPPPHLGEPGSIPGGVAFEFSHVGIVPDDAAGRRVFSAIPCFPALVLRRCFILTSLRPHRSLVSILSFSQLHSGHWFLLRAPSVYSIEEAPAHIAILHHTPLLLSIDYVYIDAVYSRNSLERLAVVFQKCSINCQPTAPSTRRPVATPRIFVKEEEGRKSKRIMQRAGRGKTDKWQCALSTRDRRPLAANEYYRRRGASRLLFAFLDLRGKPSNHPSVLSPTAGAALGSRLYVTRTPAPALSRRGSSSLGLALARRVAYSIRGRQYAVGIAHRHALACLEPGVAEEAVLFYGRGNNELVRLKSLIPPPAALKAAPCASDLIARFYAAPT
ncbi:hypothetical protein PR048_000793 [Dryococelus australis]|uniref:Uncharacterized protein n=1 Tax=Dryococelus australis TaxID=614101 RepID=A0ABQ9IFK8_9NEOP|nr:hypothetical protein PR048_000793 [Dryococelus australis]